MALAPSPAPLRPGQRLRVQTPSAAKVQIRKLRREVVNGTPLSVWPKGVRALPHAIDDLTTDFGNDVYEQMLLDSQVAATVIVLKASMIEDGIKLDPAITDQKQPNYKKAVEIRDAAMRMFKKMETPLDDVMWMMLDALPFGNKIAEVVYELQTVKGQTRLNVKAIKPKPRNMVAFAVDTYLNIVGIIGAKPGEANVWVSFPVPTERIHRRDKFAIFTWRPVDSDPRGSSILRPAYEPWWRKRQIIVDYLKFLAQFAVPSVWAMPPPGEVNEPNTDSADNIIDEETGQVFEDPEDAPDTADQADELLESLEEWQNSSIMVVPPGTEVNVVEVRGDGQAFLSGIAQSNSEITKSTLTQSLATEEGQGQNRAAAQVHQDVLDTIVRQGKRGLQSMLENDVLKVWVAANWGDDAAEELTPQVSLGSTERQDLPRLMQSVGGLLRSNYIHDSQFDYIDGLLGFPARDLSMGPIRPKPIITKAAAPAAKPPAANKATQSVDPKQQDRKDVEPPTSPDEGAQ